MNAAIGETFDFDQWSELARRNPQEFDRRRLAAIEESMKDSCRQRSLRGLQWRIDSERQLAHTPLKACVKISAMMWDSLLELEHALNDPLPAATQRKNGNAVILEFRRRD